MFMIQLKNGRYESIKTKLNYYCKHNILLFMSLNSALILKLHVDVD